MIIFRRLLVVLVTSFITCSAVAVDYSYSVPSYRIVNGKPGASSTAKTYYSGQDWCEAYAASLDLTCKYGSTTTAANLSGQTWSFSIINKNGSASSNSAGASAYCESPAEGPSTYLNDGKMMCRSVMVNTCPAANTAKGIVDVTTAYASGESAGSSIVKRIIPDGGIGKSSWCSGGCLIVPDTAKLSSGSCKIEKDASSNGYFRVHCGIEMMFQGSQCSTAGTADSSPSSDNGNMVYPPAGSVPSPPTQKNDLNGKCPAGTVVGGQDSTGMTVCIGDGKSNNSSSSTETKPSTTITDSAGNTTKTEVTTQKNADGSTTTTTTKTVTKSDGTTTVDKTTETSNNASGGSGKKDVPDVQKDLCDKNPSLNICQNSQVMGKCGDITCTGDAIQCATARAAAAMQCKQKQDDDDLKASPLTALGASTVAGNDPLSGTLPTKGNGGNVTMPSSLDNSGWLGGGAAFNDVTVSVQGKSITVPLSKATGYLVGLRYALMIVALLVSFRMLSGVILRD